MSDLLGPNMPQASRFSPRYAIYIYHYLTRIGVDPAPIFAAAGLDYRGEVEHVTPLSLSQLECLFNLSAQASDNPLFGLELGMEFPFELCGISITLMMASASVSEGFETSGRYGDMLDSALNRSVYFTSDAFSVGFNVEGGNNEGLRHFHEFALTVGNRVLCKATGKSLIPLSVCFSHSDLYASGVYARYFGEANIKFDQASNSLEYPAWVYRLPLITANRLLYDTLVDSLARKIINYGKLLVSDRVIKELMKADPEVPITIENVASTLSLSVRGLRRRLAEEGQSFTEVRLKFSEGKAKYLLSRTGLSLSEIAYEIGYSDATAFSRAFKRWSGMTPLSYREEHGDSSD